MALILGIDDAGRGPVLGPMILAGVLYEKENDEKLKAWGAKDSKLLSPKKRKEIKEKVIAEFKYHIETSSPKDIDESSNLNYLEAIKTAMIINELTKDLNEKVHVIVDCPSTNIQSWSRDVQELIKRPEIISLSCEHKADYNHPVVSAASIIAKEKREDEMKRLRNEAGTDFGSGYPADPKTKEFIGNNFDNPEHIPLIRFSWSTVKKLMDMKGSSQKKLF